MTTDTLARSAQRHFIKEQMAHVRGLVSRGEYPAELARDLLTQAARGPMALRYLSAMTGVDLHQCAFRDRIHVREVPDVPEMFRFEVSS